MSEQEHTSPGAREKQGLQHCSSGRRNVGESSLAETPANVRKIGAVQEALEEMFGEALRRDYFGDGTLKFTVHDGTIQEIRQMLERIHK